MLDQDRSSAGKIASVDGLHRAWSDRDMFAPIPDRESLLLDTGESTVGTTADRIIDHFCLPRVAAA